MRHFSLCYLLACSLEWIGGFGWFKCKKKDRVKKGKKRRLCLSLLSCLVTQRHSVPLCVPSSFNFLLVKSLGRDSQCSSSALLLGVQTAAFFPFLYFFLPTIPQQNWLTKHKTWSHKAGNNSGRERVSVFLFMECSLINIYILWGRERKREVCFLIIYINHIL